MKVCSDVAALRELTAGWRAQKQRIAFVPTMGNLHDGHLSLVEIAARHAERVVVSIYVNPLQFAPDEDFDTYPRTLRDDLDRLRAFKVDAVFTPDNRVMYPQGEQQCTYVEVPGLSDILEGECRPGFFRGVATVVLKLFNMVQPDVAVFGEKDFQQLLVIRKMVRDLDLPVEIIGGPIRREADGLAMSSRNRYLSETDRKKSCLLSETLVKMRDQINNHFDIEKTRADAVKQLEANGFSVDYLTVREVETLREIKTVSDCTACEVVILAVARLGGTRLLDNLRFTLPR